MNKQTAFLAIVCAAMLIGGCSRQQSDWQKTREANTTDAYEHFLRKYPTGEFTAQAQARVKEMYEERDWQKARDADTPEAYQAFLKQYPEGKWTEEARIRVENFTLAQAPAAVAGNSEAAGAVTSPPAAALNDAAPPVEASESAMQDSTAPPTAPAVVQPPTVRSSEQTRASRQQTSSASSTSSKRGAFRVQLGAFKAGPNAAEKRWAHLKQAYPALLGGLSSKVLAKKTASGDLYRLQAVGLSEKHAKELCSELKAKSQACLVVPPLSG